MARYNHFAKPKHKRIKFSDLKEGEKFRNDFFRNGKRRTLICVKMGELSYMELRSKKGHNLHHSQGYEVYQY